MKRYLIVTADDFGLSIPVNEAVEQAHRRGILTAASLMVGAPAAADAIARARRLPGLAVGLHLVLTGGRPVLPPASISALVRPDGALRDDLGRLGFDLVRSAAARCQLEREVAAQFAAFAASALPCDHANAHKHLHLHPVIGGVLCRLARDHGVPAIRVPLEPVGLVRACDPESPALQARLLGPMARRLRRTAGRFGLASPDRVVGLAWSGAFGTQRLSRLLERLPEGTTELYFHPATRPDFAGAAPGYRYADELAALTDPQMVERAAFIPRGGYAGLC